MSLGQNHFQPQLPEMLLIRNWTSIYTSDTIDKHSFNLVHYIDLKAQGTFLGWPEMQIATGGWSGTGARKSVMR